MSVALANVFDSSVVSNILSYYSSRPDVEWEEVYGSCTIWRTKRFITYGGGPEGGYVYLFRDTSLAGTDGRGPGDPAPPTR